MCTPSGSSLGVTVAKNARQRRTAKRTLALKLLAADRNPSTQPVEGHVRAVWSKTMPPRAHIPFHGAPSPDRSQTRKRWALDGFKG